MERIVARLDACAVPFIALLAPAGFCKTEIATAYAARFQHARRIDFAEGMSAADGISVLGEKPWPGTDSSCIIVDAAERAEDHEVRALLEYLLERRPAEGHLVFCSRREPVAFKFTDLTSPDQMAVFRRADLEMTFSEVRSRVTTGSDVTYSMLYDVYALTQGWPVPVASLLSAFARGALVTGVRDRNDPALYDLLDWVDNEVIAVLPDSLRDAMFRCIATPDMMPADFDGECTDPEARPDRRLLRNAQRADLGYAGEIRVHPLIAFAVRARHNETLKSIGLNAAAMFLERGQALRAVRTLVSVGELDRASEIATSYGFDTIRDLSGFAYPGLALEYHGAVRPSYDRYPLLWLSLLPARVHVAASTDLAREGLALLQTRGGKLDQRMRRWIGSLVAALFADAGDLSAGERIASLLDEPESNDDADAYAAIDVAHMYLDVARGAYEPAIERWYRVAAHFEASPVWHSFHLRCAARAKARLGDPRAGIDAMRSMLAAIRLGGSPALAAFGAMYAANLSWWRSDESGFRGFRKQFAQLVAQYDTPLLWRCLSALYGREFDDLSPSPELHDALAALVLASDCTDIERGRVLAKQAIRVADTGHDIALRVGTRFVGAVRSEGPHDALIDEALELSAELASPGLRDSLTAYRAGQSPIGFFQPILEHIRRATGDPVEARVTDTARIVQASPAERTVVVDVAAGEIMRADEVVRTSEGTFQLLVFLAVYGEASRDAITDALWPDLDGDAAANALKTCLHRARTQLDDSEAIVVSKSIYRLGPGARSTYQTILDAAASSTPLTDQTRAEYQALFDRLSKGLAANRFPWDWFVPHARALGDAMRTLGSRVGEDALERGDAQTTLQIARRIAGVDPLDEVGRELVLRAYAKLGNRSAALREFEEFSEKLQRELGAAPSERLRKLVTSA